MEREKRRAGRWRLGSSAAEGQSSLPAPRGPGAAEAAESGVQSAMSAEPGEDGARRLGASPRARRPQGRARLRLPRGIPGFILRRALLGLLTLFLVSLIVFAATQVLPGDAARAILGRAATPESLAALRKQLNLGQPVVQQYVYWLAGFVRGDLGESLAAQQPVTAVIGKRLLNSAVLVLFAAVLSIPLSILPG